MSYITNVLSCIKHMKGTRTTILARILRLSIISIIVVAVVLMLLVNTQLSSFLTDNYKEQAASNASLYAATIGQWTDLIKQQIENQAYEEAFIDTSLSMDVRKEKLAAAASTTEFKDFSIADQNGKTYSDTDISERDYFINALNGTTYISSPVVRKTDGSLTIMVGSKMKTGYKDTVIYGGLDVDFFSELVNDITLGESGMGFIVDKEGTIIAYPDMSVVEEQENPIACAEDDKSYKEYAAMVSDMIKGNEGTDTVVMPDGETYLVGYCPIGNDEGWSIAVIVKQSDALRELHKVIKVCITITAVLIVLEIIINLLVAGGIALPVRKAAEKLERIAAGDLTEDGEALKGKSDETGVLINNLVTTGKILNEYIGEIGEVLKSISTGELDIEITREYAGDFVAIRHSLNLIIDSLNNTFMNASATSENLLEGARQVEMASQALASASTQQASAVVEITASVEGISRSVSDNTADVVKVNELTKTASANADNGNVQMGKMINAMNEINNSSQNIAKIMKVIDDISFQTNILALNASVEAARAGIHGRGFAVVAEEVRSLAGKSSEAATEIAEMIDDTIRKIETGTCIASDTASELSKIVKEIDEIADIMEHIAGASKDEAVAIEQVNTGIEQISAAVQNNSATSEECAASSVELASQSESLMRQIKHYHLR